jgi:hypothetical protein
MQSLRARASYAWQATGRSLSLVDMSAEQQSTPGHWARHLQGRSYTDLLQAQQTYP